MVDREELGRIVRDVCNEWARERPDQALDVEWRDADPGMRDLDCRIGEAVAARVLYKELGSQWADKPLPEDEAISAAHPLETGRHDIYAEAMRLVGARHSKGALVELVNWLLWRMAKASKALDTAVAAQAEAVLSKTETTGGAPAGYVVAKVADDLMQFVSDTICDQGRLKMPEWWLKMARGLLDRHDAAVDAGLEGAAIAAAQANPPASSESSPNASNNSNSSPVDSLVWRVVANAGRVATWPRPRWVHVREATGFGRTESQELCQAAGFDPDEMVPFVDADDGSEVK